MFRRYELLVWGIIAFLQIVHIASGKLNQSEL